MVTRAIFKDHRFPGPLLRYEVVSIEFSPHAFWLSMGSEIAQVFDSKGSAPKSVFKDVIP